MSESKTSDKAPALTFKKLFSGRFIHIYALHNNTTEAVTSPYSDHACKTLAIGFGINIKNLTGHRAKRWFPFYIINANLFYSTTLEAGKSLLFLHGKKVKSSGYLDSNIAEHQASYVYSYTHHGDPHTKADDDNQEEARCVI